ncbi:ImmA/IrrE family metallo-endopeptidase [Streptomyces sp. A3M-1-3]|uniref:helix-turn-helix domain-containing protein n=1 Tax=Streptomyces sp. A3M-1-3 TaxID=2962044 RepID=UPI0020B7A63A|nr:XRE family transcriptional regulator [Streptomyces sp. A3M-1-3]MCP3818410.1 ImmA/IrrE family metallo-endopeptidase [Streptomyces sp. A3M-1-3]
MRMTVIDRVRKVMDAAAVPQSAFAKNIGLTPDKLSKSLSGVRRFTSLDLARIAECGETTVDWLLTGREPLRPVFAARTSGATVDEGGRDRLRDLLERFTTAHEVLDALGRASELPELPCVRTDTGRYVDQGAALAEDALERLAANGVPAVGDLETSELVDALEHVFGVDVAKISLPDGVDGAAWQADGFRLIMTSQTPVPTRQRFTLAHELGHILARDAQDLLTESQLAPGRQKDLTEVRANVFAANLLMPRPELSAAVRGHTLTDEELWSLVVRFKVSPSALAARLSQLGFIDAGTRSRLRGVTTETCHLLTGHSDVLAARTAWSQAMRLPFRPIQALYDGYVAGETTLRPLAAYTGMAVDDIRAAIEPEPEDPAPAPAHADEGDLVFQP